MSYFEHTQNTFWEINIKQINSNQQTQNTFLGIKYYANQLKIYPFQLENFKL